MYVCVRVYVCIMEKTGGEVACVRVCVLRACALACVSHRNQDSDDFPIIY